MRAWSARPRGGRAILLVAGALLLLPSPGTALDPGRRVTQYVRDLFEEELPQSSVHAIRQSRDGYLWIASYRGLVRFDGIHFNPLPSPAGTRLSERGVTSLAESSDGILYAGSAGDGLLRVREGRLEVAPETKGLPSPFVQALFLDRAGLLWVGTKLGAAAVSGGKVANPAEAACLARGSVRAFAQTADGTLWAGREDGQLCALSGGTWRTAFSEEQARKSIAVTSLLADGDGLWVGTYGGLFRIDADRAVTPFASGPGQASPRVRALHRDRDGSVWVGTGGGGIGRLSPGGLEMLTTANGLANDFVRSIGEDREGNLWIGTNGGLVRLENGLFVGFTEWQGLTGNFVRTVIEDSRGRILAGSDGGGLQEIADGRVRALPGAESVPSRFIRSLAEAQDALWVGTGDAGVARLSGGKTRNFGLADGLPSLATRMVLSTRSGAVWVATDKGLVRLQGERFLRTEGVPALDGRVVALLEGRDGTLWAGTYEQGLVGLRGTTVTHLVEKDGLAGTTVFALHEDEDGTLWITTASGLSRLKAGALQSLGSREGLASPILFSILDDGLGNFWFSSDQGVMKVPRSDVEEVLDGKRPAVRCRLFGHADGLPSRQCNGDNQPAAWRARDGRLWFPTARGIAMVDPSKLAGGRLKPPVLVERLLVDGRAVGRDEARTIPRRARRLEFEFAVLSFGAPDSLSVRYRLEGFDDAWRDAGNLRKVTYTSLPPGPYVFRVSAASNEGWVGEASASYDLTIQPYVTETWGFRAGAVALGIAFAWGLFRTLSRWQYRREEKLNALIEAKTRDLAEAKERAEEANRRLEALLRHDLLTGVANRLHFNETLEAEWRRARRTGDRLGVAFFDIDRFKAYNDAFGHQAGDECLRRVATVLADGFRRAGNVVARWGGEEFVVLLPSSDVEGAAAAAQRIVDALAALAIPHVVPSPGSVVTVSAGVAAVVPGEGAPEVLLAAADAALYEAKRQGRNRVVKSDLSTPAAG